MSIPFIGTGGDAELPPLEPWDTMKVADQWLPGYVRVTGSGLVHDFQKRKTPGKDGANTTDLGRDTAQFNVLLVIGNEQDWFRFCELISQKKLQPTQVSKSTNKAELQAVAVVHPAINALGVNAAKVQKIGVPQPGTIIGTVEVEMQFQEHMLPVDMAGAGTATSTAKDATKWERGGNGYGGTNTPPTVATPQP